MTGSRLVGKGKGVDEYREAIPPEQLENQISTYPRVSVNGFRSVAKAGLCSGLEGQGGVTDLR